MGLDCWHYDLMYKIDARSKYKIDGFGLTSIAKKKSSKAFYSTEEVHTNIIHIMILLLTIDHLAPCNLMIGNVKSFVACVYLRAFEHAKCHRLRLV